MVTISVLRRKYKSSYNSYRKKRIGKLKRAGKIGKLTRA